MVSRVSEENARQIAHLYADALQQYGFSREQGIAAFRAVWPAAYTRALEQAVARAKAEGCVCRGAPVIVWSNTGEIGERIYE